MKEKIKELELPEQVESLLLQLITAHLFGLDRFDWFNKDSVAVSKFRQENNKDGLWVKLTFSVTGQVPLFQLRPLIDASTIMDEGVLTKTYYLGEHDPKKITTND